MVREEEKMKLISFRKDMIELIKNGKKTQTRRPVGLNPSCKPIDSEFTSELDGYYRWDHQYKDSIVSETIKFKYGNVGDLIRIKRTDIILKIIRVRVQRLHDITEKDAKKEGMEVTFLHKDSGCPEPHACRFSTIWNGIYTDEFKPRYQWQHNPWVFVIDFKVGEWRQC